MITTSKLIPVIAFLLCCSVYGMELQFTYMVGDKYKVDATINGKSYADSILLGNYEQSYKIITEVLETKPNNPALLKDEGYYYIHNTGAATLKEVNSNVKINYHRDTQGIIFASLQEPFPIMRNIPYLPQKNLEINETWEFEGNEVQDFFNDKKISVLPLQVTYTFLGPDDASPDVVKISYTSTVDYVNDYSGGVHENIVAVQGIGKTMLYFNAKRGMPSKEEYNRHYKILIKSHGLQTLREFVDHGIRTWVPIEKLDTKLQETLEEETKDIEDLSITRDDRGIKLSLENIEFLPDSATLTTTERARLDKVAKVLQKYKNKASLVVGHTTDRGTEANRQKLSLDRARSVANYLIDKDAITSDNSQIMGKGGDEPLLPNTTAEGLRKNRRVEIYLLEE